MSASRLCARYGRRLSVPDFYQPFVAPTAPPRTCQRHRYRIPVDWCGYEQQRPTPRCIHCGAPSPSLVSEDDLDAFVRQCRFWNRNWPFGFAEDSPDWPLTSDEAVLYERDRSS